MRRLVTETEAALLRARASAGERPA
jgi:hypothetical protein